MPAGESRNNEKGRISINVNKRRQTDVKDTFFQFAEQTCLCYFFYYGKSKGTNLLDCSLGNGGVYAEENRLSSVSHLN